MKRTIVFLGAWAMMSAASAHAQTPETTVPLDTTDIVDITGRGSLGVSGGAVLFLHGGNYGNEGLNKTRLIGQAVFKYNFTPALAGVAEFGWGWNTYSEGAEDTIVVIVPVTLGIEYRRHMGGKFWPHAAIGGGLYWMGVKDTPDTYASAGDADKELKWTSPGLYGKIGTEYLFNNGVSINFDVLFHRVWSQNWEFQYTGTDPNSPLNNTWGLQNVVFSEARLGVNYYFAFKHEDVPAPTSPPEEKK